MKNKVKNSIISNPITKKTTLKEYIEEHPDFVFVNVDCKKEYDEIVKRI